MPFISIPEEERKQYDGDCGHPEHNPPHLFESLSPGKHVWRCPACGKETAFMGNWRGKKEDK